MDKQRKSLFSEAIERMSDSVLPTSPEPLGPTCDYCGDAELMHFSSNHVFFRRDRYEHAYDCRDLLCHGCEIIEAGGVS